MTFTASSHSQNGMVSMTNPHKNTSQPQPLQTNSSVNTFTLPYEHVFKARLPQQWMPTPPPFVPKDVNSYKKCVIFSSHYGLWRITRIKLQRSTVTSDPVICPLMSSLPSSNAMYNSLSTIASTRAPLNHNPSSWTTWGNNSLPFALLHSSPRNGWRLTSKN